jgi:hypothetical protein
MSAQICTSASTRRAANGRGSPGCRIASAQAVTAFQMIATSSAGAWIVIPAIPSGSGRRETYRSARALRCRSAAPSRSAAITARAARRATATTVT